MNDKKDLRWGGRFLAHLAWLLPLAAVVDWWLLRAKLVDHPVRVLASLGAGAVVVWLVNLCHLALRVRRGVTSIVKGVGLALLLSGLALAVGSGIVNWAWSVQGYVVLQETDAVPLLEGGHLRAVEKGPLADLSRSGLTLQLVEFDLRATDEGGLFPESTIRVRDATGKVVDRIVNPGQVGAVGSLRFFQGAYGFAPRLIVQRGGELLFDDVVTFSTRRMGPASVDFTGTLELEEESLVVDGRVDTSELDEAMRGHVALALSVSQGGRPLGSGRLLPGHFAEVDGGYRVGFGGMEQWSEIDFSRRNYRRVTLTGFATACAGIVWTVIAGLSAWKRGRA